MIILDTNIVSGLMRQEDVLLRWADGVGLDLATTSVTRAEVRYGLALLPEGRRRSAMTVIADGVFSRMRDRTLNFDSQAADAYGTLLAHRRRTGRPMTTLDAQIAAITMVKRATLATRNTRDFGDCGIRVVNPFSPE